MAKKNVSKMMPMRADGRSRRDASLRFHEQLIELRDRQKKSVVPAPTVGTLHELKQLIEQGPKAPLYVLPKKESIRKIGKVVFGGDGFNRVKREEATDIGPHFDAYARHFAPWTIHSNSGGRGRARAIFLPKSDWLDYIVQTDELTTLDEEAQEERFEIGSEKMNSANEVYEAPLSNGSLLLLWHGVYDDMNAAPPSVHEFTRGLVGQEAASYVIYAKQKGEGNFEGFIEV